MHEKSELSAQCISRKLLKWQLLSTSLAVGLPSPFSFYLRGSEANHLFRLSHLCHIWPIQTDSFVCVWFKETATQPQTLILEDLQVTGMVMVCEPLNLNESGPKDQTTHRSNSFLHLPILSSTQDHIYPNISNMPHYKSCCFQSKLFEDIVVLGDWGCSLAQRGERVSQECVHMLALVVSERISPEIIPRGRHGPSSPLIEQGRSQRFGAQIIYLREVTAGRKPTFQASPFPNILDNVYFEETSRWASVVTSLPSYTRENKTETGRIPTEGRLLKKLPEKLKCNHEAE